MTQKIKIERALLASYIAATEKILNKTLSSYDNEMKFLSNQALSILPQIKEIIAIEDRNVDVKKYKEQKLFI